MQFRNTKHISESAVYNARSHYYIIQTMKRSAAPSNTHPSGASKKMKPTKVVESSVIKKEIKPLKVVDKSGPLPSINAKQQKAFHHLLSAAAYNSVLEGISDSTEGLRELCARYYHGFDEDNIGIAASFLQGDGRFGVLWDCSRLWSFVWIVSCTTELLHPSPNAQRQKFDNGPTNS